MAGQLSGGIRSVWSGVGRDGGEPQGHRCSRCWGPYGKSAIPCPNEPEMTRFVTAEEKLLHNIFETPEEAS